jgi:NodT family efflux transporter outer membrane factor (OMF) lipoprotein
MVLTLSSCALGSHYVRPEAKLNEQWQSTSDPQISTQAATDNEWWKGFNDPTLERLIQTARNQNLTLQAAGVRIMQARAVLGIAIGNQYPQLQQAFGSATRVGLSENVANNASFVQNFWDAQLGFDVAWEADFWNKYGQMVKAQGAALMSSVADYQSALVSLTAEVARTYTAIRSFEVLIEQDRSNLGMQEESMRMADARFRNGATSELDVSQARTLLESTRATIAQRELSLAQTQNALASLLGQPTGSVQKLLQGPKLIPTAPAKVAVGIPAQVLRRRPDIRAAELVAMARMERIGVAKADLYPRFILAGTVGLHATDGGAGSNSVNLLNPASLFYTVGPRISWPFFNYGRLENQVRVEDARFQEALLAYQHSVLMAAQEVEDSIAGFVKVSEASLAQQSAVTSARRSVQLANLQYRDGAVDYQRVLDAQRSQLQEESKLVNLRATQTTHVISLYKALGGGWEPSVGQPFLTDATRMEMEKRTNWGDLLSTQAAPGPAAESAPSSQRQETQ